jgi:hypothetical protein
MRQGIKSFSYDALVALPDFSVLKELTPHPKSAADCYPSANRLRHYVKAVLAECSVVQRAVGIALFGADRWTEDLSFEARQDEAGRRYNPSRPIGRGGIRKRPYGQQWKIIGKLADSLIESEAWARQQPPDDPGSDWDAVASRAPSPRPLPPIPQGRHWEDIAGYRWVDYETELECSRDYAQLSVTTKVHVEVLRPGSRTYFHTFEPLSCRRPHIGASDPVVDFPKTEPPAAAITYIGRIPLSAQHPTWRRDYFDLGADLRLGEVLYIVFRHTYANPTLFRPVTVPAFVEFDDADSLFITASCFAHSDDPDPISYTLREHHPVGGTDYHLWIPRVDDDEKRFLRNPDDWEKVLELEKRGQRLTEELLDNAGELADYFDYPEDNLDK